MPSRPQRPRRPVASGKGQHPPTSQVAALCWRRSRKGLRVLLVTSRDSGRWVIPKGWPMRRRTGAEAAAREAWEEAGVRGEVRPVTIGIYTYRKILDNGKAIPCAVLVYPLEVQMMLREYPETGQRNARWFSPAKAAKRVREQQLAALIREFDPDALDDPPQAEPAVRDAAPGARTATAAPGIPPDPGPAADQAEPPAPSPLVSAGPS